MPTRRLHDLPGHCRHPDHNPPNMIVLSPGVYEHVCAGCKQVTHFVVTKPELAATPDHDHLRPFMIPGMMRSASLT